MSNLVGRKFGEFTVVKTAAEAAQRWAFADFCGEFSKSLPEGSIEEKISTACCRDEYLEMESDSYIMGVGLYTYQESMRRRA